MQKRRLTAKTESHVSAPVDINLFPNQRGTYQIKLDLSVAEKEPSFWPVELSLSEEDGLRADDRFYLAVSIPGQQDINILLTGEGKAELFLLKTAMDTL